MAARSPYGLKIGSIPLHATTPLVLLLAALRRPTAFNCGAGTFYSRRTMYDFTGAFIGFGIVCGLIGATAMAFALYVLPWLWTVAKPYIHALTA